MKDDIGMAWSDVSKLVEVHKKEVDQLRARVAALEEALKDSLSALELWKSGKAMATNPWSQTDGAIEKAKSLLQ